MPDLSQAAVVAWTRACAPGLFASYPEPIRAIENDDGVLGGLVELGRLLDRAGLGSNRLGAKADEGVVQRDMRTALTQLGPARLLRLLRWLGHEGGEERASILYRLLNGSHQDAQTLREAVNALNKRDLLKRIFDEERLTQLRDAAQLAHTGEKT